MSNAIINHVDLATTSHDISLFINKLHYFSAKNYNNDYGYIQ